MAIETIAVTIGKVLRGKATGTAWDKLAGKKKDALRPLLEKWLASFQSTGDGEEKLNTELLRERFTWAGCAAALPKDPDAGLQEWFGDLRTVLEDNKDYRREHQLGLQSAIRDLSATQAAIENDSLARKVYLESVVRQHCYIRFSGMAVVDKRAEVEMARVFVMPRVAEQTELREKEAKTQAAYKLFSGKKAPRRLVILGGPGSGKTTLLEALTLAFARREEFAWARELPDLLPVFYRVRDLEQDLQTQQTIWDCLQQQCSRRMGQTLPHGFFKRQMAAGGLLVLFDGLDEAGTVARRNEIVDMIGEFAAGLSKESRVAITSRPHDYRHRFDAQSYPHVDLCEFDDGEIQRFIEGWQGIHEPDRAAAKERGDALWNALQGRKDILPLARNALLLTMIVRVHFGLGGVAGEQAGVIREMRRDAAGTLGGAEGNRAQSD